MDRFRIRRWLTLLAVWAALLIGMSGCASGVRATSWMGLTVVDEGLVAADLQQVRLLKASDAAPVWSFPTDPQNARAGVFYVTPAVDEDRVVVASQVPAAGFFSQPKNVVWALDRKTGNELWRFDDATGQYVEGGALGGGLFVIGNGDHNVYAVDAATGTLRWTFKTGYRVWATPLIVSDTVYIGSMDHHLYALRLSDGQVLWDFESGGAFAATPVLHNGTLYIGAFDDKLYAIDAQAGTERWHFAGANWFWGGPVVHADTVYAVDVSGNVYAVNAETGAPVWPQPRALETPVRAGPALTDDGSRLFVSGQNGTLYALDTADGFVVWSSESEGSLLSPPVVSGAVVYESRISGTYRIRALYVDNGRPIWNYPPVAEQSSK